MTPPPASRDVPSGAEVSRVQAGWLLGKASKQGLLSKASQHPASPRGDVTRGSASYCGEARNAAVDTANRRQRTE